ncbi:MAG TPA: hypothetical protein DDW17_04345 [Deltaproteobacteria bacterium]|nr:hypothetical protein [Deltaproteobacteria bacterium]
MGLYKDLFNFSAKVGCLEGYLYERKDVDLSSLPNWIGNIEKMFKKFPREIKADIYEEYVAILKKILLSAKKILDKEDKLVLRLKRMISEKIL